MSSDAAGAEPGEQGVATAWGHGAGLCWVSKADLSGVDSIKSMSPAFCQLKWVTAALACLPL